MLVKIVEAKDGSTHVELSAETDLDRASLTKLSEGYVVFKISSFGGKPNGEVGCLTLSTRAKGGCLHLDTTDVQGGGKTCNSCGEWV